MLNSDQLDEFRRSGVLLLRGVLDGDQVQRWRKQVWRYFGKPATGEGWAAALHDHKSSLFTPDPDPSPNAHPVIFSLFGHFHQRIRWAGENDLILRPPEPGKRWLGARTPHLDFPIGRRQRDLVNSVLYLSDVGPCGGAFMYWPGSHQIAWQYFREAPLDYCSQGGRSQGETFKRLLTQIPGEAVEFIGQAGDLLLWHSFVMHSASINLTRETRIAVFGRWGEPLSEGELPFDFQEDMWSERYWRFRTGAAG